MELKRNSILKMMGGMIGIEELARFWKLMYWVTHGITWIEILNVEGDEYDELVLGDVTKFKVFLIMHQESENMEWMV